MNGSNLHVVHVIAGLGLGGAERMLASLVNADRPNAPRQTVINLLGEEDTGYQIDTAKATVHSLGLRRAIGAPRVVMTLARLLRALSPDAIQSWMYNADLIAYWAWRRRGHRNGTRLYWGIRCSDMDLDRYGRRLRWTIRACAARSGHPAGIVANSHAGADVHRSLGYDARRMTVIENGIDTAVFKRNPAAGAALRQALECGADTPLILHVARVDPMKNHGLLLEAAIARPDFRFVAVGAGTDNLDGPENFRGLGARTDLPALYSAADLLVMTSSFGEGFPNAVGEAMACSLPVVATDVGDAARIVGDTGVVCAPDHAGALLAAIDRQMARRDTRTHTRMDTGPDPRTRIIDHFSLNRAVRRFDDLHRTGVLPPLVAPDDRIGPCAA